MLLTKLVLTLAAVMALYSAETNASCTLGLLPFGNTLSDATNKEKIIRAYETKGYEVVVLDSHEDIVDLDFLSDSSVDCTSTFLGTVGKTTISLVDAKNGKIVAKTFSPSVLDVFTCKIDLHSAIKLLPSCQEK